MRQRARRGRPVVAVTGLVVALAALGLMGRARADDPPAGPAKAECERRTAAEEARRTWLPAQKDRMQRWRRGGRFDEISAAVEDALGRFPDDEAVTLVVRATECLNRGNADVTFSDGPDGERLDAWCLDIALRALERLPRPPSPDHHARFVSRIHLARTPTAGPADADGSTGERRRVLSAVLGFLRRWFDETDPLWDPTTPCDHYPPRRPSDRRWQTGLGARGPEDEQEFLRVEEAYYATVLANEVQGDLRRAVEDVRLPSVFATLGRLFPEDPASEAELRAAAAQVPELDVAELVGVARRAGERAQRRGPGVDLRIEEPGGGSWAHGRRKAAGQSPPAVLAVWNGTDAPTAVPIGLARVAVVYGNGPADEQVLPLPRAPRADDLVVVGPKQRAEFPLAIPLPRSGLARIVVVLANDAPRIGETEGVWTGADRLVEWVDVVPPEGRSGTRLRDLQDTAQRAGVPPPQRLEDGRWMVEPLARAWPDDRSVEFLRVLAVRSDDVDVVRAALESLIAAFDRGHGRSAHFAFAAVAADEGRPLDVRLRALDGLARFAHERAAGGSSPSPQVRVVVDEALPRGLVEHVRARLASLESGADGQVARRARAALGR